MMDIPVIEVPIDFDAAAAKQLAPNSTHHAIAVHWLGLRPAPGYVGVEGKLWSYSEGLYRPVPMDQVEVAIGKLYDVKLCRRKSDYAAIARHAYDLVGDPRFFEDGPVGLATPAGFWEVDAQRIVCRELTPDLRQRFAVPIVPDARAPSPLFDAFLDMTFRADDSAHTLEQQALLQEIVGSTIVGLLPAFEKVVLLKGEGESGKSTLLRILRALIPPQFVTSVSPFRWADDYQVATLAGKKLNVVGELPGDKFMPADAFKTITGRDMVTGRFPYGRPFEFTPHVSHYFNSNHYINTRDHTSAFWRRWLVLLFENPVPRDQQDRDLDQKILGAELPAVLAWALEGAQRVLRHGFTRSEKAEAAMAQWRLKTDAVSEFVHDPAAIALDASASTERTAVFHAFTTWCTDSQRKPMGKALFYERLESLGYRLKRVHGKDFVDGLALASSGPVGLGLGAA